MPSPARTTQPADHFSLNAVTRGLNGRKPPQGPFSTGRPWTHEYEIVTLASVRDEGAVKPVGLLRVAGTPDTGGRTRLEVSLDKPLPGNNRERLQAELTCRNDALATPSRWDLEYRLEDSDGAALPGTDMRQNGQFDDRQLTVTTNGKTIRRPLEGPATIGWSLFHAVQRFDKAAHEPARPLRFTLIDHFDQIKPDQVLAFRKQATVSLGAYKAVKKVREQLERGTITHHRLLDEGGTPTRMFAYEHLGDGILPTIYWTDEAGRLLFVVSGLEAYLWNPQKTDA